MGIFTAIRSLLGLGSPQQLDHRLMEVRRATPRSGGTPLRPSAPASRTRTWRDRSTPVTISGLVIKEPSTYVVDGTSEASPACPATIPLGLHVGQRASLDDPGYWPTYQNLNPAQRLGYLRWLAGGRCDRAVPLGFPFIFFYGLEWRALIDGQDRQECLLQAYRLYPTYGSHRSLHGYVLSFIGHLLLLDVKVNNLDKMCSAIAEYDHNKVPAELLEGVLHAHQGQPIPVSWMWHICAHLPGCAKTVVDRKSVV